MIFRIADDCDLAAVRSYHVAFGYGLRSVVGAFGVNVGFEREQELFDCRLVENGNVGDWLERGDDFGAFCCGQDWAAWSFLNSDLLVGVDTDDQDVAQLSGAREISHVADMKHVETAVSENDSCAFVSGGGDVLD